MRLSRESMYQSILAEDTACNGIFFTGVLSTGIYCLPSCKARKPKLENVLFFPNCTRAREHGLRPCKKCHPDDFEKGADPVLDTMESLVRELRSAPEKFPDVRSFIRRSGFGATRLGELTRLHFHLSPSAILTRARIDYAKRALWERETALPALALEAGYQSLSVFHDNFRAHIGLSPGAFRELRSTDTFEISLPTSNSLAELRTAWTRDTASISSRFDTDRDEYLLAILTTDGPALLRFQLKPGKVEVKALGTSGKVAYSVASRLLGLGQDTAGFLRLTDKLQLKRLVQGREGLHISLTPDVHEGLVWSILGQQITFSFACTLKRRLTELRGKKAGLGLLTLPDPNAIAGLTVEDLVRLKLTTRKSEYLLGVARQIEARSLDPEALVNMSATRAERRLLEIRGFGAWSTNYVMMRALGFADCVPFGDTGLGTGLKRLLRDQTRPEISATKREMLRFSPYRSLATAHLWQLAKEKGED